MRHSNCMKTIHEFSAIHGSDVKLVTSSKNSIQLSCKFFDFDYSFDDRKKLRVT